MTESLRTSTGAKRLPALDGYRGLFVSLVLLYHFGVTALVGGWVGLNHFFTFSGYLITRLLISERARSGAVDVMAFYRRRAERLVPALLVVCAAVLAHALLFSGGATRSRVGGDVLATLGFVQNWRLIARDDAYFDMVGDPSPLRHAWTLGVEEQFYLLIPALVIALFVVARTSRATRVAVVVGLALLSSWWTAHLAAGGADYSRLYYGTDTRAQALLVGAAAAFALGRDHRNRLAPRLPAALVQTLGVIGFVISLSAFFLVDADSAWLFTKGGMLLFAVGAVFMGLSATDPRPLLISRLASWGPLVLLGQMTYGLYLYHWPIRLWLGPVVEPLPLVLSASILFGVTVGLAYLSFRYLEVPVLMRGFGAFRRGGGRAAVSPRRRGRRSRGRGRPVWVLPLAATLALALVAVVVWRMPVKDDDLDVPPLVSGQPTFVAPDPPRTVGLLGDSVGASLAQGWQDEAYPGVTLVNQSRIGCDLIDAPMVHDGQQLASDPSCRAWRTEWPAALKEAGAKDLAVLAGAQFIGDHEVDGGIVRSGTPEMTQLVFDTLDDIEADARDAGVERVHVITMPCRQIDPNKLDPRFRFFAGPGSDPENIAWVNRTVAAWAERGEGRSVVDLWQPLCADGSSAEVNGVPLYHDTVHFSPGGAAMVWTWLVPKLVGQRD